jgi:hypothetical protein
VVCAISYIKENHTIKYRFIVAIKLEKDFESQEKGLPFLLELRDALVENKALAPVANCILHRFCNRCNASGTKALTL